MAKIDPTVMVLRKLLNSLVKSRLPPWRSSALAPPSLCWFDHLGCSPCGVAPATTFILWGVELCDTVEEGGPSCPVMEGLRRFIVVRCGRKFLRQALSAVSTGAPGRCRSGRYGARLVNAVRHSMEERCLPAAVRHAWRICR